MSELQDLFVFMFACLSIVASIYELYFGLKERKAFSITISLAYLIPLLALSITSAVNFRLGHWSHYAPLLSLGLIIIFQASIDLKIAKQFRLLVFLLITLAGFFNYFTLFPYNKEYKIIAEKGEYLKIEEGLINIILIPTHPFYKELALYYGKVHKGYKTLILDISEDNRELGKVFELHKEQSVVNFLFLENNPAEKEMSKKVIDLLSKHFIVKKEEFHEAIVDDHYYLRPQREVIKSVILYKIK